MKGNFKACMGLYPGSECLISQICTFITLLNSSKTIEFNTELGKVEW